MTQGPLRDAPGWAAALKEAENLYGHGFSSYEFAIVGNIVLPDGPAGVSTGLILDALRLISTARREQAPTRRKVVVDSVHPHSGPQTNVIDGCFAHRRYVKSEIVARARVLGESEVRDLIKSAYRHMVSNIPLSNDNDPDFKESPWFGVKVQHAWVRERAARRGAAQ